MIHWLCNRHSLSTRWYNSYQSGVVSVTVEFVFHYRDKFRGVQEEQLGTQNTFLRRSVNQFATIIIHHDILLTIREKLPQNRPHWTSNSYRAEHEKNPLMVNNVPWCCIYSGCTPVVILLFPLYLYACPIYYSSSDCLLYTFSPSDFRAA